MSLRFPDGFLWGSSTAAAQVETASEHLWKGFKSRDGHIFDRTTDHELHREEDIQYIRQFGNTYRCGVDWARLQHEPFAPFNEKVVREYKQFFQLLNYSGMRIMLVLHHFTHPRWFEEKGGWTEEDNVAMFVDFTRQCIVHFSEHVVYWNTFNEPNVFALNGYVLGAFPPKRKNILLAHRVLRNMGMAHKVAYTLIKEMDPQDEVGISLNTAWFQGRNLLGWFPAKFTDWWFHRYCASFFAEKMDFWGLSYYAYIPFKPGPITELDRPGVLDKMHIPHDKMWGYQPEGLMRILNRFHKKYKKNIIICENGICTDDDSIRINAIRDYLSICHEAIQKGIALKGYIHWSTWDNFEWNLGPTYRFGLVRVNFETMERSMTDAGLFYADIVKNNALPDEPSEKNKPT